jgi:hypothetical protein
MGRVVYREDDVVSFEAASRRESQADRVLHRLKDIVEHQAARAQGRADANLPLPGADDAVDDA